MNFDNTFTTAERMVGILIAAGYTKASIVGGALRHKMLGGGTSDVDIAVICDGLTDYANLRTDLNLFFGITAWAHDKSGYDSTDGFYGDWRVGDINIIAYSQSIYPTIEALVGGFDLNINQWQYVNGRLVNNYFDGQSVKVNPTRDGDYKMLRLSERILRFKTALPHLDWSSVNV